MNSRDVSARDAAIPLSEQAAQWWVTLHSEECTAAERRAFAEWVGRSPERVEAYLRFASLTGALHSSEMRWPDVPAEELVREAKAAPAEVVHLESTIPFEEGYTAGALRRLTSIAAALAVVAAGLWIYGNAPERYETALGEQRSVPLDDGSLVTLNTSSTVEVDFQKNRRLIRLLDGEALFQVTHDARRPFDVIAGGTIIRAVGTRFNVDLRRARTTVTVLEGRVLVGGRSVGNSPVENRSQSAHPKRVRVVLDAAERVVVSDSRLSAPERVADIARVTAWTQRRLIFDARPLGEVAEEFNRYNRRQIRIEDTELRQQEVTGVFETNDPESFMAFLSEIPGVRVEETEEGHRIVTINQ